LIKDESILDWIRAVDQATAWTTSVCTGSIILAAAGLLTGRRATTHWASRAELASLGARLVDERVVRDGKIITAAGVSAGIDMALTLAALIAGNEVAKAIQLLLEYDPKPPFDAGAPSRAHPDTLHRALVLMADAKEQGR
jgi:transcriptional regulator GlxA family with amidase domain